MLARILSGGRLLTKAKASRLATNQELCKELAELRQEVVQLRARNASLEAENAELKRRLKLNSSNSSKPPSSDGLRKPRPKSSRVKSGLKPGGQKGHRGKTLQRVATPDYVELHSPKKCQGCGDDLRDAPELGYEARQVFEIPAPKMEVFEHRATRKECQHCGVVTGGSFPASVAAPVQYGSRAKALMVYLHHQQLLPYKRVSQLFEELYGVSLSQGTLANVTDSAFTSLAPFEAATKDMLRKASVLHADETGIRVGTKLHWLHNASTDSVTFYHVHPKRGAEAMNEAGILPNFQGVLIHDCWKPYFSFDCKHGLCNAHVLRELKAVAEQPNQSWALQMAEFLRKVYHESKDRRPDRWFSEKQIEEFNTSYFAILKLGYEQTGGVYPPAKDKVASNLLARLVLRQNQFMAFTQNPDVPFHNNQAEQDVRMMKVKQKISGCFRSQEGARNFARIRGYLSTMRKQQRNLLEACQAMFLEGPCMPNHHAI